MEQYIPKSVIIAEIERLIKSPILYKSENVKTRINVLEYLLSFLDTVEVKEMNLEKELESFIKHSKAWVKDNSEVEYNNGDSFNHIYDLRDIAKHFFELGLSVSNKNRKESEI